MKEKKDIYEPPIVRDLSGFSANGQVYSLGFCMAGTNPTEKPYCTAGSSPGQNIEACDPTGYKPHLTACSPGTDPASGCLAGSYPDT